MNCLTPRRHDVRFRVPRRLSFGNIPVEHRSAASWFLDLLHRKTLRWQYDDRGFTQLKAEYIHKVVPARVWPQLRNSLESSGALLCDHHAVNGLKSFGYRLTSSYVESKTVLCSDYRIARKVRALQREARSRRLPVHNWLESKLDRLRFDLPRALAIVETLSPKKRATRARRKDHALSDFEYRQILREQCRRIAERSAYFSVDAFGRIHTPVTSLPKELRCCLTIDDELLVGVDIKNSQPLFAGLVCRAYCRASATSRSRIRSREFGNAKAMQYKTRWLKQRSNAETEEERSTRTTMCKEPFGTGKSGVWCVPKMKSAFIPTDIDEYLALCSTGRLYESLVLSGEDRNEVKRRMFSTVFFGKPVYRSKLGDRFRRQFPSVDSILRDLKTHDFQRAAWTMQFAESSLIIGQVCRRIMKERPAAPVVTIHDSVVTTREHLEFVELVVREAFKEVGTAVALHHEEFT